MVLFFIRNIDAFAFFWRILLIVIILGFISLSFDYSDDNNNNGHYYLYQHKDNLAYAHFFGTTKKIDSYQIIFQPFPPVPFAGEKSTLSFSILDKDNLNVNNIHAALLIKDKNTGKVVDTIPYKFYEFSDISFPYIFQNNSDYLY
jgi:hypothetical protein